MTSTTVTDSRAAAFRPTNPAVPMPGDGALWAVRDTLAMTWRNLTTIRRVPQLLVFAIVQPTIFVLMFRYVFGGSISIPGHSYVDYLMPGIFVQTCAFGALNTAIGLAEDKGKGLLERLRSLPMSRSAVLGGRVLADTTRNVFVVVLMLAIGYAVGFRAHTNVVMVALGVLMLVLFGFALSWIFALIGLSVSNGEAAQAAAFPMLAPLVFASNAFVDPAKMPGWLQAWARHQPVSAAADAVRACMLGGPTAHKVLISVAWSLGIAIVLSPVAVRRYRRL
ncbi:MAG: transporter, permease component [Ilumatobacteraceae bacterium]|nr:transporter, permease component [Ilumatobacteraceae bacterium]